MTTNPNTTEDPAVSTESTETGPEGTAAPEGLTPEEVAALRAEVAALRGEAAKRRTKSRSAGDERDALAATVARYQRAEVEALAGAKLGSAADLWLGEVKLEDLLAEDGTVDPAKVEEAASAVVAEHPNWAAPRKRVLPRSMGQGRAGFGSDGPDSSLASHGNVRSMQEILRGR